jgi:myo-inositol-1(or 4)-monophosphatase
VVREKLDHTPVTGSDARVERTLRTELERQYPGIPVVSEEDETSPRLSPLEDFFLLDPIDGTWNFANGIPVFLISVAFIRGGQPRVGVLHNPISGLILSAVEGKGAFQRSVAPIAIGSRAKRVKRRRLKTAPYRPLSECQVHRHDRRLDPETAIRIVERVVLNARGVRDLGSITSELALIASGRSDALVGYHVANWDVAAASLILEEAGGVATQLDGTPIDFTAAEKFSVCAAGNPRLHRELLSALS